MNKFLIAVVMFSITGCNFLWKNEPKIKKFVVANNLIGLQFNETNIPPSIGSWTNNSFKLKSGKEYSITVWHICPTGENWKTCSNYYEAVSLNEKINAKNNYIVLETKQTPNKNIESELCFDLKKRFVLAWTDYSENKIAKIISAWKVAENEIKWVNVPIDSVECGSNEEE